MLNSGAGGNGVRADPYSFLSLAAGRRWVLALEQNLRHGSRGGAAREGLSTFEGPRAGATAESQRCEDRKAGHVTTDQGTKGPTDRRTKGPGDYRETHRR